MTELENKANQGFTLVEVLIASAILAIGLLAVSTMIARSTIQDSRAYYMTRASMIVEEFFESQVRDQYVSADYDGMTNTAFDTTIDGITYSTTCTIVNDTPIKNTKQMTCQVSWNNKGIQARTTYAYVFSKKF